MNAIGGQALIDLKTWYCTFFLEPYKELFEPGKQNATFDNTKRRYAWFKRTVKEVESQYSELFPSEWHMNDFIAYEFCRTTKLHLDQILSASFQDIDVELIIETMQMSIEFENELHKKFSSEPGTGRHFKFEGCISQCFEPYLRSYSLAESKKLS